MINKDNLLLFQKLEKKLSDSKQKYSIALVNGKEIQLVDSFRKMSNGSGSIPYIINDKDRLLTVLWGTTEQLPHSCHGTCILRVDNPARMLFRFKHEFDLFTLKNLRAYLNQQITSKIKFGESIEDLKVSLNETLMEIGLSIQMLETEENSNVQET